MPAFIRARATTWRPRSIVRRLRSRLPRIVEAEKSEPAAASSFVDGEATLKAGEDPRKLAVGAYHIVALHND